MKIGLFFGSFNPVHIGHMIIANYVHQHTDLDRIWMVLSPQSPFKKKENLARDYDRLHLLNLATEDNDCILPSSIEFSLPKPSYTIDTLTHLKERYPSYEFTLIMGGDNLLSLPKWKNSDLITDNYHIYIYKRPSYHIENIKPNPKLSILNAPLLDISASHIRKLIKEGKSVQYLLPDKVYRYLKENNVYRK